MGAASSAVKAKLTGFQHALKNSYMYSHKNKGGTYNFETNGPVKKDKVRRQVAERIMIVIAGSVTNFGRQGSPNTTEKQMNIGEPQSHVGEHVDEKSAASHFSLITGNSSVLEPINGGLVLTIERMHILV